MAEIGEYRRIPKFVMQGGAARVTKVDRRWVHYEYPQRPGEHGKMRKEAWAKLKRASLPQRSR
jgi:hypothetical protein